MTVMKAKNKTMMWKMKKKKKKQGTMLLTMVEMTVLHPLALMTTPALLGFSSRIQMKKMFHDGVAGANGNIRAGQLNVNLTSRITKLRKNFLHPLHIKLILQSCWR